MGHAPVVFNRHERRIREGEGERQTLVGETRGALAAPSRETRQRTENSGVCHLAVSRISAASRVWRTTLDDYGEMLGPHAHKHHPPTVMPPSGHVEGDRAKEAPTGLVVGDPSLWTVIHDVSLSPSQLGVSPARLAPSASGWCFLASKTRHRLVAHGPNDLSSTVLRRRAAGDDHALAVL